MMPHPGILRPTFTAAVIVVALCTHARACDTTGVPAQETSAKLAGCVAKLEADLEQLTRQVAALQGMLAQAHEAEDIVMVRTVRLDGPAKNNPPLASGTVQCPSGSWVSGIEFLRTDPRPDPSSLQRFAPQLRYSCRALK
jgi:hypothetical protein